MEKTGQDEIFNMHSVVIANLFYASITIKIESYHTDLMFSYFLSGGSEFKILKEKGV